MRVSVLTKEWPPDIYGGAGVHVEHLVSQLRKHIEVDVQCFGAARTDAFSHEVPRALTGANAALQTLGVDLSMVAASQRADLLHSHTWYTNMAGHIGSLLYAIPHVLTAHSLEPLRPWKAEQLAGGYRVSSWVERTAYESAQAIIAVSHGMKNDVLECYPTVDPGRVHVVHNGIDTSIYRPDPSRAALTEYGVPADRPYVLFVGRITRQKGLVHLLNAARGFDDDVVLVMCASSPDTPQIGAETALAVRNLKEQRGEESVVWIQEPVPRQQLIELYTHALAFACPSIYEPLGIVNLEAMACETAVVASAVGGIPEVVDNGVTGILVPYSADNATAFEEEFAAAVNALAGDPSRARIMGSEGRRRAVREFGWDAIAERTIAVYRGTLV